MIVVGAGMAGLLAAATLRGECLGVYEAQPSLPNNHSAVLRFRSSVVGDSVGIEFERVRVLKAVAPWRNPVADAMAYSRKTNGTATLRSIASATGEIVERYVAPRDFIARLAGAVSAPIYYEVAFDFPLAVEAATRNGTSIVSTIPMPALMKALGYPDAPEFPTVSGRNIVVQLRDVDAYASLYVPDPRFPGARISITGSEMVIECYDEQGKQEMPFKIVERALDLVGLERGNVIDYVDKGQRYAKILPIDEEVRRRFILWATEEHGVYSLGRFATWRPNILLDDLVQDIRHIRRLASGDSAYRHYLKG